MDRKSNSDGQHKRILIILLSILALSIVASVVLIILRMRLESDIDYMPVKREPTGSFPVAEKKEETILTGLLAVADADADCSNNIPLSGAQVNLKGSDGGYDETVTVGEGGQYRFEHLTDGNYVLTVSKSGYLDVRQDLTIKKGETYYNNAVIEVIDTLWSGMGTAAGKLCDAADGKGIAGAKLEIRRGIGQTQGEAEAVITTDEDGKYQTPQLAAGNYCAAYTVGEGAEAENGTFQIKILGAKSISGQNVTVGRKISAGKMRIELYWGIWPTDMDSHLYCEMENGDFYHVYYWDKAYVSDGKAVAELKQDDHSSYGPEITQIDLSNPGLFTFSVLNYTGDEQENISGSKVLVYVYMDYDTAPSYAFRVPDTGDGGFWTVFSYDTAAGLMTQIDEIGYEHPVQIEERDEEK